MLLVNCSSKIRNLLGIFLRLRPIVHSDIEMVDKARQIRRSIRIQGNELLQELEAGLLNDCIGAVGTSLDSECLWEVLSVVWLAVGLMVSLMLR